MQRFHFGGQTRIQIQVISRRNSLIETLIRSTVTSGGMGRYDFSLLPLVISDFIAFNVMVPKNTLHQLQVLQLTLVFLCVQINFHVSFHWLILK